MKQLLIDVPQVLQMLGVDPPVLADLILKQGLPALDVDGEIKFHEPDLRRWTADYAAGHAVAADTDRGRLQDLVESSAAHAGERLENPPEPVSAERLAAQALACRKMPAPPAPELTPVLFDIDVLDDLIEQYEAGKDTEHRESVSPDETRAPCPERGAGPGDLQAADTPDRPVPEEKEFYPVADDASEHDRRALPLFDAFAVRFQLFDARIMLKKDAVHRQGVFDEIARVLDDMQITVADFELVKQALIRNADRWVCLAEAPNPFLDKVNVRVSADARRAYLVISAVEQGASVSQLDVDDALARQGVRAGMNRDTVRRVIQDRLYGHLALVALGREPVPGQDAAITFHFNRDRALTPELLESGDVDHKNLNAVESATAGQLIVSKTPPSEGEPGEDVRGRPLEARHGRDMRIGQGRNTVLDEDGAALYAECDGHVYVSGGMVHVEDMYVVDGDVDYATGNIDFTGLVLVRGFVREGFQVNTNSDIRILGGVEGAQVITSLGAISIRLGVQGRNKAVLLSEGGVRAKFIAQATVETAGDVVVQESIMHSTITAGRSVLAEGPKGSIIGGAVRAQETVVARFIGSEAHVKTNIVLESLDPESGLPVRDVLGKQRAKVSRELDTCMVTIKKLKQKIDRHAGDSGLLQVFKANVHKARGLSDIMNRLNQDTTRFHARYGPAGRRFIRATSMAYPQVHLTIEGCRLPVEDTIKAASFSVDMHRNIVAL